MNRRLLTTCIMCLTGSMTVAFAQTEQTVTLNGSVQSDVLVPRNDSEIGAEKDGDWAKTNTYIDLNLQSRFVDAGGRFEYLDHPLPGYEPDFRGWGTRHYWVKGKLEGERLSAELTLGSLYEQFGSGLILRTYEERALGIDNSLLGARLTVRTKGGLTLKALTGRQRRYWHYNDALISGADAEYELTLARQSEHPLNVTLGGSWVNKRDNDDRDVFVDYAHKINFPKYVNAWDVRLNLSRGDWRLLGEYAQKTDDPSFDNGYTFRRGNALLVSASYSRKGLSALLQTKRSENMASRSDRMMDGTSSMLNHLPSFTQDQTYALAALYPYATQLATGEWGYQAELGYNFKRRTTLGGPYGMNVKLNYSYIRAIDRQMVADGDLRGTGWFTSSFLKWGNDTYYQDLDVTLTRKLSRDFRLTLMYMNQRYNQAVIEGHGDMIHSDIFVADGKYQLSPKTTLRGELQYLSTAQDQGDWLFGLLELSLVPHWMLTVSDMYNSGDTHTHYYQGFVTFNTGSHRLQLGYGRTRAGLNCSGGVCRYVPATSGMTLSYNYNF